VHRAKGNRDSASYKFIMLCRLQKVASLGKFRIQLEGFWKLCYSVPFSFCSTWSGWKNIAQLFFVSDVFCFEMAFVISYSCFLFLQPRAMVCAFVMRL
jgi:hypothetical protein